jgi:hypothetical protein
MISNTTDLISEVMPHQKRSKPSADCLLSLAAAPTFAIMALLSGIHNGGMQGMLCSAAQDVSPLTGMVPMYLLMSAFHMSPWLRLLATRRGTPAGPDPVRGRSSGAERPAATRSARTA